MIELLVVCAVVGTLASVLRVVIAWKDYAHRWERLPVEFYGKRRAPR